MRERRHDCRARNDVEPGWGARAASACAWPGAPRFATPQLRSEETTKAAHSRSSNTVQRQRRTTPHPPMCCGMVVDQVGRSRGRLGSSPRAEIAHEVGDAESWPSRIKSPPTSAAPASDHARWPQMQHIDLRCPLRLRCHTGASAPPRAALAEAPTKKRSRPRVAAHTTVHRKTSHELGTARELQAIGRRISGVDGRHLRQIAPKKLHDGGDARTDVCTDKSNFAQFSAIVAAVPSLYTGLRTVSRLRARACPLNAAKPLYRCRHSRTARTTQLERS